MNQAAAHPIEIVALVTGLGGGLALFLYGMQRMTEALTTVAGGGMKNPLARLVEWLVPERPQPKGALPLYLDPLFLEQPAVALDQVRRGLVRLAECDRVMLEDCLAVVTEGSRSDVAALAKADDEVDALHGVIVTYLGKLSQQNLVGSQPKQLDGFIGIANEPNRLAAFQVETDIVENLQRLNALNRLIARQLVEIQGSSGVARKRTKTTEEAHTPSPDAPL